MEGYLEVWGEARWNLNIEVGNRKTAETSWIYYFDFFFFLVCVFLKIIILNPLEFLALGVIGKIINMNFRD